MSAFVKPLVKLLGLVFLVVGIAAFFFEIGDYDFETTQNVIHIIAGVAAFALGKTYLFARMYLLLAGIVFVVLGGIGLAQGDVLGMFIASGPAATSYLIVGVVCLLVRFMSKHK